MLPVCALARVEDEECRRKRCECVEECVLSCVCHTWCVVCGEFDELVDSCGCLHVYIVTYIEREEK
jgi:hypothetical protein